MKTKRVLYCCVCLAVLIGFGVLAAAPAAPEYEKVLEVTMKYGNGQYSVISEEITYGTPPDLAVLSGPIKGVVADASESELESFFLSDPGVATGEIASGPSPGSVAPFTEYESSGELDLNLPVSAGMQTLSLYDTRTGTLLFSSDLSPAFTTFCLGYPKDPDCLARATGPSRTTNLPGTLLVPAGLLAAALPAVGGIIYLAKRVRVPQLLPAAKQTVLIVDDSPDILDVVSSSLSKDGYRCITAPGGNECLAILAEQKPDVILLDVIMAPLDGWSTLRQIKKNPATKSIPVLMLTGNRLTARDAKDYHICIEDYIQKPFREEEVCEAIEQILARKKVVRESLALAGKAGVDREKFCRLAALSTRISADKKIIRLLQKPDKETGMARPPDPETKDVISDMIRTTHANEIQLEELKSEIFVAFTKKGFVPPSW
jgi:CheY-like chemotaxis protein